eukprot:PhF_6_TR19414/c0_g1_i2/m.28397
MSLQTCQSEAINTALQENLATIQFLSLCHTHTKRARSITPPPSAPQTNATEYRRVVIHRLKYIAQTLQDHPSKEDETRKEKNTSPFCSGISSVEDVIFVTGPEVKRR